MMAAEAAKNLQGNRSRPRSIVPAIPLPYVQKRKLAVAALKEDSEVASNVCDKSITLASHASEKTLDASHSTDTNGTAGEEIMPNNGTENAIARPLTSEVEEKLGLVLPDNYLQPADEEETDHRVTPDLYEAHEAQLVQAAFEGQVPHETATREEELTQTVSDKQSNPSISSYKMPPAQFVPSHPALPHRPALHGEALPHTKYQVSGGTHPMHHAHPSQGSLVFMGFPDSNNSSPAPPLSSSGMPQYQFQPPPPPTNGPLHHLSNGFQVPPPPGFGFQQQRGDHIVHNTAHDNFSRRQQAPYHTPEGYSPATTPGINESHRAQFHDPPTIQNSHSRSLGPHDQDSHPTQFSNSNPTFRVTNGSNGHSNNTMLYYQPQTSARGGSELHGIIPHPSVDDLDGLFSYVQGQFADPSLADYTLEVRYADDRAAPIRIPGHNLLFARSPALKRLMMAQAHERGDVNASRTIIIESTDRFLCTNGFWTALQRLYGGPLLNLDTASALGRSAETQDVASSNPASFHRFDLALGYAAAGHILQIPPVLRRGIELACHLVNWLTLEKALDFALDGGINPHWTLENNFVGVFPNTYGPAVNMLIHSALNFLIANFPAHLDFDVSGPEPAFNSRLPAIRDGRVAKHNPRLSSIKFGDHPTEEPIHSTQKNANPASLISRVLINLPYQLLKYVLEAPTLGSVDWATSAMRESIMHEVINEREKRRIRVRNDQSVSNEVRMSKYRKWESVGWQEAVSSDTHRKMPILTRTWVDIKLPE